MKDQIKERDIIIFYDMYSRNSLHFISKCVYVMMHRKGGNRKPVPFPSEASGARKQNRAMLSRRVWGIKETSRQQTREYTDAVILTPIEGMNMILEVPSTVPSTIPGRSISQLNCCSLWNK